MQQMDTSSLKTFAGIAYLCLERSREERPVMSLVVKKLEKSLRLQELYDFKLRRSQEIHNAVNPPLRYRSIKEFKAILSKGFLFSGGKKGQQQFTPSVYSNSTGGRHLEPNFYVSKYTPESDHGERNSVMLNGQTTQSSDNTNRQHFASSHDTDQVYDSDRANSRLEDPANDNYFQPSPMNDGVDSYALKEVGPGIDGFQIIGDAKPGGKLLGCGFPVRGTSVCMFQWVRLHQDGTRDYIDGATSPEYVVTADDVDELIAVECIPMDEQGRQGETVQLFANEQNKITCDPNMQQEIDNYMSAGQASFGVLLLMNSSENWEQTTLTLGRSKYQIRINQTQEIVIDEKYSRDLSIKIPSGLNTQFVLIRPNGTSHSFNTVLDSRMRDVLVLTMRMFQRKALDERRKTEA